MSPQHVVVTPPTKDVSVGVLNGTPEKRANTKPSPFEMVVRVCTMAFAQFVLQVYTLNSVCEKGRAIMSPTDLMVSHQPCVMSWNVSSVVFSTPYCVQLQTCKILSIYTYIYAHTS